METIIEHVLAVVIGGFFMGCSLFVLFLPFMVLVFFAKRLPGRHKSVKDDIVQAQWEYDRKFRRRD